MAQPEQAPTVFDRNSADLLAAAGGSIDRLSAGAPERWGVAPATRNGLTDTGEDTERASPTRPSLGLPGDAAPPALDVPVLPRHTRTGPTLHAVQEWEGYVVAIKEDEFVANLIDLTAGDSHATEQATVPLDLLSPRDVEQMEVGSIFRWVIGYGHSPGGTRHRESLIVFRQLPRMTASDFERGEAWGRKMERALSP